jgi:hypothetical protein
VHLVEMIDWATGGPQPFDIREKRKGAG